MPRKLIIHPFLLALYTVLVPMASNIDQIPPGLILRSLVLTQLLTGMALLLIQAVVRDWELAGFITFFFIAIGLNYGHFLNATQSSAVLEWAAGIAFILLAAIILLFVVKRERWEKIRSEINFTRLMTILVIILLLFPGFIIGGRVISTVRDIRSLNKYLGQNNFNPVILSGENHPDIYYIIVDGYARGDVLEKLYGYDNSEFLSYLEGKGFFIAESSRSNYVQTTLSLTSSLNISYLDQFASTIGEESGDRVILSSLIENNSVFEDLRKVGYKIVTFYPGFIYTDINQADIRISPFVNINEFEGLLLYNSIFRLFLQGRKDIPVYGYKSHREIVSFILDGMGESAKISGPKIVFMHILAPHPPFLFDRDGQPITPDDLYSINDGNAYHGTIDEYIVGYTDQLTYLNSRLERSIDSILSNSAQPPIIIIQGDHGPGSHLDWKSFQKTCLFERTSILNAYYLPGVHQDVLYSSITPVNTFRMIFNLYFNQNIELFPDHSYYSSWDAPYHFIEVPEDATLMNNCSTH